MLDRPSTARDALGVAVVQTYKFERRASGNNRRCFIKADRRGEPRNDSTDRRCRDRRRPEWPGF
jgi:hypothetical protein